VSTGIGFGREANRTGTAVVASARELFAFLCVLSVLRSGSLVSSGTNGELDHHLAANRLSVPPDVLMREVDGESVLLNLLNERYYTLDEVGTRMWTLLTTSESIEDAWKGLLAEYEVEPETLRRDLQELIEKLVENGLLELNRD